MSQPILVPPRARGRWRDHLLLAGCVAAPLLAGGAAELLLPADRITALAVGAATGGGALVLSWRSRRLRDVLGSFRFAAAMLSAIAIVVAVGTLVPQEKDAAFYAAQYPHAGGFLAAFGVIHMFHGAWFTAQLGVVAAALAVSAARRWPPTRRTIGFFLCHVGLIVILGGASLSVLFAVRGRLDLRVGDTPLTSVTNGRTGEEVALGFGVRLDGFTIDTYAAEHRLAVYDVPPGGEPRQLATLDEDVGVVHRLPDGASYRVRESAGGDAAHTIAEGDGPARAVAVGDELSLADGRTLQVIAFYPHFSYDIETRTATSVDDDPVNPALEVQVSGEARRRFLFTGAARGGLGYTFGGGGAALVVEVTDASGTKAGRLTAAGRDAIFFGEHKALAYERRPEEARSYRSAITVLQDGRQASLPVAVNAPARVDGWSLYQMSFDPRDPLRSGLEAVRDPGVHWVFVGFALVALGVPLMVNVQPWLRRRDRKGARS